ncbi:MAG: hypothetical protein ACKOS8_05430 [Gemmataceae bacterium]
MTNAPVFAAANPLLVLLVLGVTLVFYIVQAVFKSTMEPKKLQPPPRPARPPGSPMPQTVSSKSISSLEDYLKEARRRRAMESGAIPGPEQESRPNPSPSAWPIQSENFKPVLVQAPMPVQGPTKPGRPNIPQAPRPAKKAKPQTPSPSKATAQIPAVASAPHGLPLSKALQTASNLPEQVAFNSKPSPLAQLIAGSLRDPKSVASALLLREILGPPASTRARRIAPAYGPMGRTQRPVSQI